MSWGSGSGPRARRRATRTRRGSAARASGSASGRRPCSSRRPGPTPKAHVRWQHPGRRRRREHAHDRPPLTGPHDRRRRRGRAGATGRRSAAPAARAGWSRRPDLPRRVPRVGRLPGAAQGPVDGTGRRHRGGHGVEAHGSGRGGVPDRPKVGRGRRAARHPALPRVQRGRVRARHVQGPGDPRARPVRAHRGDDDRRRSRSAPRAATCTSAASTRWRAGASPTPSTRPSGPTSSGRTSRARAGRSTSSSASAPAPTSRARRPRCSSRSRAAGRSRATSRRSRSRSGCSASRRSSTTSRRWSTSRSSCATAARSTPPSAPRAPPARSCSASRGTSSGPGVYEVEFGARLRDLLELAGGVTDGRRIQAILLGGAAGAFVGPDKLDVPLTFEGTRAAGATLGSGRDPRVRRDRRPRRRPAPHRRVLPRRVVRAMRPVPRRHRAPGGADREAPGGAAARIARRRSSRCSRDLAQAMRDASICGLGQTASSAIESAIRGGLVHFDGMAAGA